LNLRTVEPLVKRLNHLQNTINMEEQGILLEEASFKFSQDPNCLDSGDEYESLEIEAQSSLGIDRDNDCFFVLKTEKWSVDGVEDLEKLFNRIRKIVINHGKK
jgi:hypothetical protein